VKARYAAARAAKPRTLWDARNERRDAEARQFARWDAQGGQAGEGPVNRLEQLQAAQLAHKEAMDACPHWDKPVPGQWEPCCGRLAKASKRLRRVVDSVNKSVYTARTD
jgi:hypothetical protein